ncbi:hypothetical protein [Vibrio panuliri]|uniref:Uncharacterized protein n=1 Tax=Vibrio panuliri TaxID=1381081 RepID=A0ABX3FTN6_9VIBR|nr:hypothetical protein [Vibrio panuliri]KAB1457106.1 hypothetical protein F7O85_04930 [Vibrio panuliri]OLQ96419.1 hypothetical protein BIY20_19020 [Vibrio panuliri]
MKKVAITIAILAATGSVAANANVTGASTTLTKNITQECNIGLWAVGDDGSVGTPVSEVGNEYFHSELNDFEQNGQQITGRAKCNSSGGYEVHVTATNGSLNNNDSSIAREVEYTLQKINTSPNFSAHADFNSPVDMPQGTAKLLGSGTDTELAEFKLKMKLAPGAKFTYAGQYTETLTFDLTPL